MSSDFFPLPAFPLAKEHKRQTMCRAEVKVITKLLLIYVGSISRDPRVSRHYQASIEHAAGGAVVGLLVLPELLQAQRLPVQRPAALLAHCQSHVAVHHASLVLPLGGGTWPMRRQDRYKPSQSPIHYPSEFCF